MADDVLVLGSGVIGLTTAILLAEAGRTVHIRTNEVPESTTSVVAGALLGPPIPDPQDPRVLEWLVAGDAVFRLLAADPETGVRIARGRLLSGSWSQPDWAPALPGFAPCTGTDLPAGMVSAFWVQSPIADMRRYLSYLTDRFTEIGGSIELNPVESLAAAVADAPVVVNCTGIAALDLTGDPELQPVFGQHVIVANPGLTDFAYEGGAATDDWAGYFPHGDRVVLGGVARRGWRERVPDPEITAGILQRTAVVEPRLAGAEVLGVEVGIRPTRTRVRVEAERIGSGLVIHHYGHGGAGVQLSWGSARTAADLALSDGHAQ